MLHRLKIVYFLFYRLAFIWVRGGRIIIPYLLQSKAKRENLGAFLKRLFENLGGTFIKVGQALAMRQDFLPAADCETLSELLDRVRAFPAAQGRAIVEAQLGGKLSTFFSEFSEEPIASASFSQVYRARTLAGESVAVKVMRPNLDLVVMADTLLLLVTAQTFNLVGIGKSVGILTLAREIVKVLRDELNYGREGRHLQIFQEHVKTFDYLEVPKYYPKLSGTKVITMGFVEGTTLREYLTQTRADAEQQIMNIDGQAIDGALVGSRIYEMTMRSVFELGFYHADLHPGNIILLPGNRIGLIDFGIVGQLGKELREKNLKYIEALADGRFEDAATIYATIVKPHQGADYNGLREDMLLLLKAWSVATTDSQASFKDKSSGTVLNESVEFARKHGFYLPQNAVLYYKTVMMIDHLNIELNSRYDSLAEAEKFIYDHQIYMISNALTYDKLLRYWVGIVDSLDEYPDAVSNGLRFMQNLEPKRERNPLVVLSEQLLRLLRNLCMVLAVAWPVLVFVAKVEWLSKWDGWDVTIFAVAMLLGAAQLNQALLRLMAENPPSE